MRRDRHRPEVAGAGPGRRALVIGGAGRMGGWLARFLRDRGLTVEIADPAGPVAGFASVGRWQDSALDHDFLVVAAPLRPSARILAALAARRPPGIVFDIGSVKAPLARGLRALAAAGVKVTSVHPMFGPHPGDLAGRHIVFVDVGVPEATRAARALFAFTGAIPLALDLDAHDRLVARVLGLSHALSIAFFTALTESGGAAPARAGLSSPTFDAQVSLAVRVAQENPHLYFEIQALNPHGAACLDALERAVKHLRDLIARGDEAAFVQLMARGRRALEQRPAAAREAPPPGSSPPAGRGSS